MLNRVKGATPFERRDGSRRLGLNFRRTTSNATFYFDRTQLGRPRRGNSNRASPKTLDGKSSKRDGEKAFCARQKISFHHTPKTRLRQPRARRNNATFLAKILAFSTKPSVSVVFSLKIARRRLKSRLLGAPIGEKRKRRRSFQRASFQFSAKIDAA